LRVKNCNRISSSSEFITAGLDEHGERVHSAMYYDLWSNGPFEINEFPDYTLIEHFKKPIPSFPPREAILDYLKGKFKGKIKSTF
jgi:trimethylamine monooxygenase